MSLSSAKPGLKLAIESAFKAQLESAKSANTNKDVSAEELIANLAEALTNAIHDYVLSAEVVKIPTTFSTITSSAAGPGTGTGSVNTATGNLA